jgi:hypothetical protein
MSLIVAMLCMMCNHCEGPLCTFGCWEVPCQTSKGPPVGCHSHSTHYNITYSQADLAYNQTRSDVRNWLSDMT